MVLLLRLLLLMLLLPIAEQHVEGLVFCRGGDRLLLRVRRLLVHLNWNLITIGLFPILWNHLHVLHDVLDHLHVLHWHWHGHDETLLPVWAKAIRPLWLHCHLSELIARKICKA